MTAPPTCIEAGRGPALVFLHGIGGGAAFFAPQLDHFARRFRAVAWNMPGYGDSPAIAPMTFDGLAAALGRLLDALAIDRAHLVGHSIGGMVAQTFAARSPQRVRSLVLVATSAAFGAADGAFQQRFLAERLAPLDAGRSMAELAPELVRRLVGDKPDPAGVALAQRCMAAVPEATYRAALSCLVTFDGRAALAALRMPVLLVSGARDRAAPPAAMERMAAVIPAARHVSLPGAGHLLPLERPAAFNRVVEAFLDRVEAGGES